MCLPYFSWIVILWGCELLLLRLSASSGYSWNLSNPSHFFLKCFKNSICTEVGIYEGEISHFDLRVGFQLLYFSEVGIYEGSTSCIDIRTTGFQLSYYFFSLCFQSFRFILFICYFILCFYLILFWNSFKMFKAQK